jgi:hypothetical protein
MQKKKKKAPYYKYRQINYFSSYLYGFETWPLDLKEEHTSSTTDICRIERGPVRE